MSVSPLRVQEVSTITRTNTHNHGAVKALSALLHCTSAIPLYSYRQSTALGAALFYFCAFLGVIHSTATSFFDYRLLSLSGVVTMKPTSKRKYYLINENQSLCIPV